MPSGTRTDGGQRPQRKWTLWPWRTATCTIPCLGKRALSLAGLLAILAALAGLAVGGGLTVADTDSDGDGFTDSAESFVGTDPLSPCNQTTTANDEAIDAWPPDFNDDTKVGIADVVLFRNVYESISGDGTYDPRLDLNTDGKIDIRDIVTLRLVYGETCEPAATPTPTPMPTPMPTPTSTPEPSAGPAWAFEETFDGDPPSPSQDLLPRTFDYVVTHRTHPTTPDGIDSSGSYGSFPGDHGSDCSGPPNQHIVPSTTHRSNSANPDESFYRCKNHMMSSMGQVEGYSVSAFWPRQEFDFTDGGILEFDVNINAPHGRVWWEVLIMPREQLQVAAAKDWLPIDETYPEDRIVFDFSDSSVREMHLGTGSPPPNGVIAHAAECGNPCWWGADFRHPNDPALTDRRIRRTHRIEIQENRISWGIETEDGTFDTISMDVLTGLPFQRGLVVFKTHAYTPDKDHNFNRYTFHWDNIRFSGPKLPPYEVFESPVVVGGHESAGETAIQEIDLPYIGEDPVLFGQVHESLQGQVLLSVNGNPNIVVEPHTSPSCANLGWRSFFMPIDPSLLKVGNNTFKWTVGPKPACADDLDRVGFSIKGFEVQMDPSP